jgi:hypothetical protein
MRARVGGTPTKCAQVVGFDDAAAAYAIQQRLGDEDSSQKQGNDVGHARPVLGEH